MRLDPTSGAAGRWALALMCSCWFCLSHEPENSYSRPFNQEAKHHKIDSHEDENDRQAHEKTKFPHEINRPKNIQAAMPSAYKREQRESSSRSSSAFSRTRIGSFTYMSFSSGCFSSSESPNAYATCKACAISKTLRPVVID